MTRAHLCTNGNLAWLCDQALSVDNLWDRPHCITYILPIPTSSPSPPIPPRSLMFAFGTIWQYSCLASWPKLGRAKPECMDDNLWGPHCHPCPSPNTPPFPLASQLSLMFSSLFLMPLTKQHAHALLHHVRAPCPRLGNLARLRTPPHCRHACL